MSSRPPSPEPPLTLEDGVNLRRALALAERGRGTTGPNPIVGCVLVAPGGRVVGEGWHERAGEPHAEVHALAAAGSDAAGATAYVSLEPCAHHGRTPPCADALVAAGIARVVVGAVDPFPQTDGRGIERLQAAGIAVDVAAGELGLAARVQNEGFRTWVTLGRPFVSYKAAVTLDGRMAAASGDSRWVSGEASRRRVHELRARSDAVAVGAGTARLENPALTARDVPVRRQPRRLAFGRGPLAEGSELELRSGPLADELRALAVEGVQSLLLEGGPTVAGAFLRAGLIDRILLFVAPKLVGGDDAPPLFAGPGVSEMADALPLRHVTYEQVGEELLISGYLREP